MDTLYPHRAGIDVHKNNVVVCLRCAERPGKATEEVRTFSTMPRDLLALSDWLASHGVTHVAMESTGVYWKPVFNILAGRVEVILVNAEHIKQVPGRKTDVKDCQWIAQLLPHGLLKASFVPPEPIRELRDLTRQRTQLIQEHSAAANRIQKVLEDANVKLASVATDVLGVSGRDMLEALIASELAAQYRRLSRRRGRKRALVAVGHTLLVIMYHVLQRGTTYTELGADFLDRLEPERLTRQLVKRLESLGHKVTLEAVQAA